MSFGSLTIDSLVSSNTSRLMFSRSGVPGKILPPGMSQRFLTFGYRVGERSSNKYLPLGFFRKTFTPTWRIIDSAMIMCLDARMFHVKHYFALVSCPLDDVF